MKRIIGVLIITIVWFGCRPGPPKDIIKADKMEKVLYDIHIVDGYLFNIPTNDSVKKVAAAYYDGIYKKFDIDSAIYTQSLNYYYSRPEELDKIYAVVQAKIKGQVRDMNRIDSLNGVKQSRKLSLESERKEDSLKVNIGYNLEQAQQLLYLARYKDLGSRNYIPFDLRKLKKDFDYQKDEMKSGKPEILPTATAPAVDVKDQVLPEIKSLAPGTKLEENKKTGELL